MSLPFSLPRGCIPLTAAQLLSQPLPDLVVSDYPTQSDARHQLYYNKVFGRWSSFEEDVRKTVDRFLGANPSREILAFTPSGIGSAIDFMFSELFLCGDEASVVGRLEQNAMHPVSAVARYHSIRNRFGDFRTIEESHAALGQPSDDRVPRTIPDIAGSEELEDADRRLCRYLKFVGEGKTPWVHKLAAWLNDFEEHNTDKSKSSPLRKTLGQIALYMYDYGSKYGFLTTYNQTIFLKQERHRTGEYRLYIPNIIYHTATGSKSGVSLRECLFYLVLITAGTEEERHKCTNPTPRNEWVIQTAPKNPSQIGTPMKSFAPSPMAQARGPPPAAVAGQFPGTGSRTTIEAIIDETGQLTGTFRVPTGVLGYEQNPTIQIGSAIFPLRIISSLGNRGTPQDSPLAQRGDGRARTAERERPQTPPAMSSRTTGRGQAGTFAPASRVQNLALRPIRARRTADEQQQRTGTLSTTESQGLVATISVSSAQTAGATGTGTERGKIQD
ncbi:hypothetical protein FQN50_004628 [Emmonsiellopsis sp. PD_5]|nr:hypothetical protein FQN50_004628 [Emmonsiellopsis sp. PD_5]